MQYQEANRLRVARAFSSVTCPTAHLASVVDSTPSFFNEKFELQIPPSLYIICLILYEITYRTRHHIYALFSVILLGRHELVLRGKIKLIKIKGDGLLQYGDFLLQKPCVY